MSPFLPPPDLPGRPEKIEQLPASTGIDRWRDNPRGVGGRVMSRAAILVRHIRRVVQGGRLEQSEDGELLRRYAAQRDEAAFALLVRRHGPMVWNACRRA